MKDIDMNFSIGMLTIITACGIMVGSVTTYSMKQDELFAANLDKAMEKGVDPIAVKCAYGSGKIELCTTYVMRMKQ